MVLDGANLMWAYGVALARRFGCKVYPASAGLLLALDYEARAPQLLFVEERASDLETLPGHASILARAVSSRCAAVC